MIAFSVRSTPSCSAAFLQSGKMLARASLNRQKRNSKRNQRLMIFLPRISLRLLFLSSLFRQWTVFVPNMEQFWSHYKCGHDHKRALDTDWNWSCRNQMQSVGWLWKRKSERRPPKVDTFAWLDTDYPEVEIIFKFHSGFRVNNCLISVLWKFSGQSILGEEGKASNHVALS